MTQIVQIVAEIIHENETISKEEEGNLYEVLKEAKQR